MTAKNAALTFEEMSRSILDSIPLPVFVVEEDVIVVDFNAAAATVLGKEKALLVNRRAGEIFECQHAGEAAGKCGKTAYCGYCVIRDSVNQGLRGRKVLRRAAKMDLMVQGTKSDAFFLVTVSPFHGVIKKKALLVLEEAGAAGGFRPLLPICAGCKQIRDEHRRWHKVETYFRRHMGVSFTHSLCPTCAQKYYPECFDGEGKERTE